MLPTSTPEAYERATPTLSATPISTSPSTQIETATPSPSPLPTWTGTPPTPTPLSRPHIIEILDWEIFTAETSTLCWDCAASATTLQAPRGMDIVVIQVFIQGALESSTEVTTDLLYGDPASLTCTRQSEEKQEFCGLIFGQVAHSNVTLQAQHTSGGENQLEYILSFQSWAP